LESFKLFFDNWKGRHSIYLQITSNEVIDINILIKRYKEGGIVKKFHHDYRWNQKNDDFEWT
jgi:hypothetical protein